jgi:hypothetical protein
MEHRHLILAYTVTWAVQLGYAGWVCLRWLKLKREEKSSVSQPNL